MTAVFESPGEAVVAGVVAVLAQDAELQAMVASNDKARFVEACQSAEYPLAYPNRWDHKLLGALIRIREACS
jgi:hypothetical protein